MARRAHAAGLALWLDFHYSDVWADPGHQFKPAAWASLAGASLEAAVYNHTMGALTALASQGTPAAVVQVGNEITNGMLWAAAGEPCADGGALWQAGCSQGGKSNNWPALGALVAAGIRAARAAAPGAALIIHTDLGNRLGSSPSAAYIVDWYRSLADSGAADWDAVALSFYPNWGAGNTTDGGSGRVGLLLE
jgi:arabinogalactan endo-1,4-beta-galactosidase